MVTHSIVLSSLLLHLMKTRRRREMFGAGLEVSSWHALVIGASKALHNTDCCY